MIPKHASLTHYIELSLSFYPIVTDVSYVSVRWTRHPIVMVLGVAFGMGSYIMSSKLATYIVYIYGNTMPRGKSVTLTSQFNVGVIISDNDI